MKRFAFALAAIATTTTARAAPTVWAIDDGEKLRRDDVTNALATGAGNPVWSPGEPIRLFSMRNETVAIQVVVAADAAIEGVTVDLDALVADGGATIRNADGATDPTKYVGRPIERFVEHFVEVPRASGGRVAGVSLGWAAGSGPRASWTGFVADALVPIEVAQPWAPYPMKIAAKTNGAVWIDVTVPKSQPAGLYRGTVVVKAAGATLASMLVELDVVDVVLPDRPVRTMAYYDRAELDRRIGGGDPAEEQLWRLFHRHRISPLHGATSAAEVERKLGVLDGSFYDAAHGYEGPAEGMGDGILSLGTYGVFRAPDATKLQEVERIADVLSARSLFDGADVFVYAVDEQCDSPTGKEWKRLLAGSTNANAKRMKVGWTCSEDPTSQPVDITMVHDSFDPERTAAARAIGKEVWVYNGRQPFTGTFLTDAPAISPRVDGWLGAMFDIGRWFYWETTFWYDDNKGGKGAYDPFATGETFHNQDGDYCMGDGLLVYPGKQVDKFTEHSLGMAGVVASVRLKNWRRGIEDAGYFQLAHAADAAKAEAIANALLPRVLSAASEGDAPSWSEAPKPYVDARRALLDLVPRGVNGGPGIGAKPSAGVVSPAARVRPFEGRRARFHFRYAIGGAAIGTALALVALFVLKRRARRSAR